MFINVMRGNSILKIMPSLCFFLTIPPAGLNPWESSHPKISGSNAKHYIHEIQQKRKLKQIVLKQDPWDLVWCSIFLVGFSNQKTKECWLMGRTNQSTIACFWNVGLVNSAMNNLPLTVTRTKPITKTINANNTQTYTMYHVVCACVSVIFMYIQR